jgi:hypothetical protein
MSEELDRLARTAVPDVVAAALERARERAVDRLADLLTDAIVAQALARAVPAAAPEPRPAATRDDDEPGAALYAYGITTATTPLPDDVEALTGDAPLRPVTADDLALLVSAVHPEQLRVDEDDLSETGRLATLARGHDAVVRAAALRGPVLPLRFGTVVADETAARRLLAEHAPAARARLREIGTAREWGVKLVRRLDQPVPVGSRSSDRAGVTGTEYLARRRRALDRSEVAEAAAQSAADLLLEALEPHVTQSVRRGGAPGSSLLLDLAVLVESDDEAGFLATAGELRQRLEPDALELEVSGPWPPYSFASLEDGDA